MPSTHPLHRPPALQLLCWLQDRYSPPGGIYVTENGCAVHEPSVAQAVKDTARVEYYSGYISEMHAAMKDGVDVRCVGCSA